MYAHFLKPCYSLAYLEASNIRNLMFKQSKCEYIAVSYTHLTLPTTERV